MVVTVVRHLDAKILSSHGLFRTFRFAEDSSEPSRNRHIIYSFEKVPVTIAISKTNQDKQMCNLFRDTSAHLYSHFSTQFGQNMIVGNNRLAAFADTHEAQLDAWRERASTPDPARY
jgi:hypothetical protein